MSDQLESTQREQMSDELLLRYSRQIMMPEFDVACQEKLRAGTALIVGMGGLGCPAAMYLAAAGCGTLLLADFDEVDLSNLQRQIAHTQARIGQNKAESVAAVIAGLNPDVRVETLKHRLEGDALTAQVRRADVVVDCTDNFSTRDSINQACVETGVPLVSGAAIRAEGQISVFDFRQTDSPCYHCLYGTFGNEDLTCSQTGILAPVVGIIGTMQALEALKILSGYGQPAVGRLLTFDADSSSWREFRLRQDPECPVCQVKRQET
ncbi:molybdopterin-synthase adenylyltransferase MoeB [Hahella ganghwensis]|uniref:molybdopterin-synthase adenylyltransferase MoeB n=1 Tax=Hahella ganghwensis TaxID=286420 RepID=UPI000366D61D|nr:molybdopterin-synthase adenylyltransferase MoeB [Hahella ganghwensis]